MKKISKNYLKGFSILERFFLHSSEVEELDGDLFKYNSLLHYINISYNEKLNHIGEGILKGVNDYEQISFANNLCVNSYTPKDDLPTLIEKLEDECPSKTRFERLGDGITSLSSKFQKFITNL